MNATMTADRVHSKTVPDLIAKLLAARQESLLLFDKLAAHKPFAPTEPIRHLLQRFCETLVDYLALGPFEVYEALEEQPADSPYRQARGLARQLYARISRTTQAALDFHDRYDGDWPESALIELDQELSRLGEHLAARIALEDQIVAAVRNGDSRSAA